MLDRFLDCYVSFSRGDKNIPSKNIVKTFASAREDRKLVEKALEQTGLPHGKTDEISRNDFQFHSFKVGLRH